VRNWVKASGDVCTIPLVTKQKHCLVMTQYQKSPLDASVSSGEGANNIPHYPQFSTGLGWLNFRLYNLTSCLRKDFRVFVEQYFGSAWVRLSGLVPRYRSVGLVPGVVWSDLGDDSYELTISQKPLELISPARVSQLMNDIRVLFGSHLKCTRIDVNRDTSAFTVSDFLDCCKSGWLVTPAKTRYKLIETADLPAYCGEDCPSVDGATVYIGTRKSARLFRCYDKGAESGGVPNQLTRCELEIKQKLAHQVFSLFCDAPIDSWPELICRLLLSSVDFRDINSPDERHNCHRLPSQPWWSEFLNFASKKIKLWVPFQPVDIVEKLAHLQKQYACTLAMVFDYCNITSSVSFGDLMEGIVSRGRSKYKSHHLALVAALSSTS
jgi:hypothetical protein